MTFRRFQALLCALLLLASTRGVLAQTKQADSTASAKRFAQSFYDWYAPLATSDSLDRTGHIASEVATARKPALFSKQLWAALRADFAASAKAKGDPQGIDYDPFLSGQNPCARYQIGSVSHRHNSYFADVYPVCDGALSDTVEVVAELQPISGSWQFVNFRYLRGHTDLLRELRFWRDQRRTR